MQSVPITTNIESSNTAHGEVFLIQHYVIKFVSDICHWFSPCTPVSSINKTDHHDITKLLLKVAFNTITPIHVNVIEQIPMDRHTNMGKT
jgi:hypothetical protein